MNFYDVLANGYHSPLTKTQIAELFHAGRLRRDHRCKHVTRKEWQTIDELFPLLKYQSAGPSLYYSPEGNAPSARTWVLIFAFLAAACAAVALWYYFAYDAGAPAPRVNVTARNWPRTISSPATPAPKTLIQQPIDEEVTAAPRVTVEALRPPVATQQAQLEPERTTAERRQREQEQAERDRRMAERMDRERKAAGQDIIFPLEQDSVIQNVGGSAVALRIHDIDVTSFDICVNGAWRRDVAKEKGISGSRTDETLIYSNGRARLYYVWEISGKLSHCLLRVRED